MVKRIVVILGLLAMALIASGCQAASLKTPKALPAWSRGQQVGVAALNQAIHMVPDEEYMHMLWVAADTQQLHYVRLDPSGAIQVSKDLEIDGAHPSQPRLFLYMDGSLGALWTDNPDIPRAIFLARLSPDASLLREPARLSPDGARVSDYALADNLDGSHDIFWADEIPSEGGIHRLHLTADGQAAGLDGLLIPNGENPSLQVAPNGIIHLAWVVEPTSRINEVYYATFDPSAGELGHPTRVGSYKTLAGMIAYPPTLGLDRDVAYIFWALEQRGGGLATGEARTSFVSLRLQSPQESEAVTLDIPSSARPAYRAASGSLPYRSLAPADAGWPSSLTYMPAAVGGQGEELGVLLVAEVATQRTSSHEVVWAIFADGNLKGYQLPTRVAGALRPAGMLDRQGNMHICWLNTGGFGRYEVYYASTADSVKANLDRVTVQDRAMSFLNGLWSLAPALGFFPPVFLLWTFISFVWIIVFYFVKAEGGLDRRASRVALVVAILIYLLSKLFLMPGILFYAPFLDRLPENLKFIPVLGTPLLTLLVALGAMLLYFRRAESKSLFAAYFIFVLTDALLSLLIYVPRWLAG